MTRCLHGHTQFSKCSKCQASFRQLALDVIPQIGITATALALRVSVTTVRKWWKESQQ